MLHAVFNFLRIYAVLSAGSASGARHDAVTDVFVGVSSADIPLDFDAARRGKQEFNISINCKHLYSFVPSRRLYQQLVHYPQVTTVQHIMF